MRPGSNTVNGTTATFNVTDKLTGGTGTDTPVITENNIAGPFTFGNGTGSTTLLTNFETIDLNDTANANHTVSLTFTSTFQNKAHSNHHGSRNQRKQR